MRLRIQVLCAAGVLVLVGGGAAEERRRVPAAGYRDWRVYHGGAEGIHYSALDQINRGNVAQLEVAWTFDTGDAFNGSEMQCNPIVVDGVLFATTPKLRVMALDAATGRLRWSFDPNEGRQVLGKRRNRGVTYWSDGKDRRVFFVARHFLSALDAGTGRPVAAFGKEGRVDLREGLLHLLGLAPEDVQVGAVDAHDDVIARSHQHLIDPLV